MFRTNRPLTTYMYEHDVGRLRQHVDDGGHPGQATPSDAQEDQAVPVERSKSSSSTGTLFSVGGVDTEYLNTLNARRRLPNAPSTTSVVGVRTRRPSCFSSSRVCRGPTTSTTAPTTAIRHQGSDSEASPDREPPPSRWMTSTSATCCSSSAATRPAITRVSCAASWTSSVEAAR